MEITKTLITRELAKDSYSLPLGKVTSCFVRKGYIGTQAVAVLEHREGKMVKGQLLPRGVVTGYRIVWYLGDDQPARWTYESVDTIEEVVYVVRRVLPDAIAAWVKFGGRA